MKRHSRSHQNGARASSTITEPASETEPSTGQYGLGKTAIVVGAGPGGLLTALLLAKRGYNVDIYEKRLPPDQRERRFGSRSIVFGLLLRGQAGLKEAGVRLPSKDQESVWLNGLALSKGAYSNRYDGVKKSSQFNALPPSVMIVERAALIEHMVLELERLQPSRIKILYGHSISRIDFDRQEITFQDDRGRSSSAEYELLVGCDGRNSFVRNALQERDPEIRHEEHVAFRSYKGFHGLPATDEVDLGDDTGPTVTFNNYVHGKVVDFSSAFWPTRHGTVTGHVSCPQTWFDQNPNTAETFEALFREKFPLFPKSWIPEASRQIVEAKASPNGSSIKCSKLHGPRTVILGDAAHGVTPAMGQGCNAALESAHIFVKTLDECGGDAEAAPPRFTAARIEDAHALFNLDRAARSRSGAAGFTFSWLTYRFHVLLATLLKKLLPSQFNGSSYANLFGSTERYSKVQFALRRDAVIFVLTVLAAAAAIIRILKAAAPMLAALLSRGAAAF